MKAIVYHHNGSDVLRYEEIEKPSPADKEILVKVRAASVNPLDWRLMKAGPYIARLLGRPGRDVAGQVEAVGTKVTQFKTGDEVFGLSSGAFAEYACAPETKFVVKPGGVTFEQAASAPVAALTALQGLRDKGQIRRGQSVLINGASGGVGTFAVQIAKSFDAEVTGVCSTRNVDLVRSIGANRVIDYTQEDFTKGTQRYDLILDCVGNHSPAACRRVLNPSGRCVIAGAPKNLWMVLSHVLSALVLSAFVSEKFVMFIAKLSNEDLTFIAELIAAGTVTPVIDRRYKLSEVPEAMRYAEEGHVRGKVIITLDE